MLALFLTISIYFEILATGIKIDDIYRVDPVAYFEQTSSLNLT